jgi:hypothetical protein
MVKVLGYILLVVSCLLFVLMPVVPMLNFSKGTITLVTTILFIAAEILFYLSIFIIGKDIFAKLVNRLKFWKRKNINTSISDNVEQK